MTPNLLSIHPLDTIEHAAQIIYENKIGCLPVVADGELAGIVTSSDMMRTLIELIGAHGTGSWLGGRGPEPAGRPRRRYRRDPGPPGEHSGRFCRSGPAGELPDHSPAPRNHEPPKGVAQSMEEAGYKVNAVESSAPVTPSLEES